MTNQTFTTKTGEKFEVGAATTWTALNGTSITDYRVNTFNPKTGHGWSGVMTAEQLNFCRGA